MKKAKASIVSRVKNRWHWKKHIKFDWDTPTKPQEPNEETLAEIERVKTK